MAKEICISSTPHETRLAILEDDQLTEIYYERENEYTLAGSIYKGRVTRVLPGMQSAFVDLGLERDAFLYVTDFMEEQEDGADFEKVPGNANGNGGQAPREAQQPKREAQAPREGGREGRGGREPRENRPPRVAISVEPQPEAAPAERAVVADPSQDASPDTSQDEQQGTRRWRGRRGRRRGGRENGPREAVASPAQAAEIAQLTSGISIEIESGIETGPTVYEEAAAHGGSQAAFSEEPPAKLGGTRYAAPARQESRAPRPVAPSGLPAIVLPGESLSRYGAKPIEPSPKQASAPFVSATGASAPVVSAPAYKPSTLVEVVPGWDGGAELPGESLSRYRGKPQVKSEVKAAPPQPAAEIAAAPEILDPPASSELVEHAWQVPEQAEPIPTEEAVVGAALVEEAASSQELVAESSIASEPVAEESTVAPVEEAPVPVLAEQKVVEPVEAAALEASAVIPESQELVAATEAPALPTLEASFEPESASASYRVDPVAPREYRLSPAVEDEPEVAEAAPAAEELPAAAEAPTVEPAAAAPEIAAAETASPAEASSLAPEETAPAVDSLGADPLQEAAPQSSATEVSDPEASTSAAFDSAMAELPLLEETEFVEEDEDSLDGPLGFSPGSGPLEEEIIEEEEYDSEPIRAYADEHDLDDLEEETLDHLAGVELGEMVRDAHLEQRIGASPDGEAEETDVEFAEALGDLDDEDEEEPVAASSPAPAPREGRTDDGRRGGRGPRRRGRPNGGGGGGGGSRRAQSQLSDLPIISELLKQGQEILVQIAKEPIAKKGARITSHIALPGRFLVFMPTVNHVGVSRKISSDEERQRLKRILISEKGTASGGFIVRTAADGASEEDLRADIRFLINLWTDIKQRADDGKAPALIYHDLNLIERVLRDQVSANFSTIWVDNEAEYERILRFLQRFEPSLVRRVKLYTKETPLFEQFGIQDEIGKALKSKVWLKSGGSIVINQTEALVAIDINTGKYVGKTARLEDTILKTNLDAIPEIVRQIRLRDLGGIIVIDFIDMDERKNRHRVMAALEEELKSDRAPSKVLQFNDFGLVAITRKRVKQSLERTLSVQCEVCAGTGMVKSPTTVCNEIYTELRKMQKHLERGDVMLRVHPEVVKTLKSNNAKWLNELEEMTRKTIIVKSDPALHPEQFDIQ
jgi:ribonuclease G